MLKRPKEIRITFTVDSKYLHKKDNTIRTAILFETHHTIQEKLRSFESTKVILGNLLIKMVYPLEILLINQGPPEV
jgi:hypothetical protein